MALTYRRTSKRSLIREFTPESVIDVTRKLIDNVRQRYHSNGDCDNNANCDSSRCPRDYREA